jgi:hypothetical protein
LVKHRVSISSLLPDTLSIGEKDAFNKELTKIMNNYYYNQKYFSDAAEAESLDEKPTKFILQIQMITISDLIRQKQL